MTQETQLLVAEGALGGLDVDLLPPKDGQDLSDATDMLLQRGAKAEEVVHIHDHRSMQGPTSSRYAPDPGSESVAAGAVVAAATAAVESRPRVIAAFMTRMSTDDEPWRPNGISFHSNWPSWERQLASTSRPPAAAPGGIPELDRIW